MEVKIQTVSSYNNFFLTGRLEIRYVNMNDCIEMSFDLIGDLTGAPLEKL